MVRRCGDSVNRPNGIAAAAGFHQGFALPRAAHTGEQTRAGSSPEAHGRQPGDNALQRTNIANPAYFHKVVDCQWACPAHTPVPEYIRLIAQGRYGDAYMVNWVSNVFPGILGRTCDRPCEPACRRGRVEESNASEPEPVAICRLKRVAADMKDDVRARMPTVAPKNGKRIACVGAGPASLTVARDLAPLGYEVTVFDGEAKAGGFMRTQIPRFRLPESVIDEETRLHPRPRRRVPQRRAHRLDEGAAGAGLRRHLRRLRRAARARPGRSRAAREAAASIHIGIDWLASVSFGHVTSIGQRVIVLGGGNTAMDCCRSARRLGGTDVKVIVRSGFEEMKASPWEKEDAHARRHPDHQLPRAQGLRARGRQAHRHALRDRARRSTTRKGRRTLVPTGEPDAFFECDEVLVAVGQENAFPWIERDCGIAFDKWGLPMLDNDHLPVHACRNVFFGGDAAFGPKNIITAVAHGHEAAVSIDRLLHGEAVDVRPAAA